MKHTREVTVMALAQFFQFVILTANFRAIASGMYAEAGLTAGLASVIGYLIVRKVATANNHWGLLGMVIGGGAADMVGIWLTKGWQ